jgi:hypothetical protein
MRLTHLFGLLLLIPLLAFETTCQPWPRPDTAGVVNALVEAVATGDEPATHHFLEKHATLAYRQAASPERHVAVFDRMHRALGRAEVLSLRTDPQGEHLAQLRSGADGGVYSVWLGLTGTNPQKVETLRWAPAQPADTLLPAARREVLDRLFDLVERIYVLPDTAQVITAHLRSRAAAGAYDKLSDSAALAEALTTDLQAVNGDRHLYVRAGPPPARPPRGADSPPSDGPASVGFTRVEQLDGNIGYIELGGVLGRTPSGPADFRLIAEVLRAVEGSDAVILDLRRSPGGSAQLANALVSHFLPPGVHLFSVESRMDGRVTPRHTLETVPGPRLLETPLYVLISRRTFSAGEDIAFSLRSQERATLVGERTGGGGRNNTFEPLGHGLTVSISFTRVLDARTGEEAWERGGVPPHIEAPFDEAFDVALRLTKAPR